MLGDKMSSRFFIALLFITTSNLALGNEQEAERSPLTLVDVLEKGGWIMVALAILSIFTLILVTLYFLTLRRSTVVTTKFMNAAEAMIRKRDYLGLIAYCHRRNELVARVAQKALDFLTKNPGATQQEIREVAEAEGSRQAGKLTQRISYLADIGGISPMVGLLGTVIGMIKSFMEIANGNIEGTKQLQLAEGVWEALITTAAGLVISIIAMSFYSYFRGRVQNYIAELEAAGTHLLALVGGQLNQKMTREQAAQYGEYPAREI